MKRKTAYKLWIKDINKCEQIFDGGKFVGINFNGKIVKRINIVGNIIDKFDGSNFTSIIIDDSTGIIEIRDFEEKLKDFEIGDSILVIGKLKNFNERIYLGSEVVKKVDPLFLIARKIELEKIFKNKLEEKKIETEIKENNKIKYEILKKIKENENNETNIEDLYLKLDYSIDEIKKAIEDLLEEGKIYEP
ncbi:MAG: OB-fold nucleic acid binding domain-containing protein, partial [Candidatus Pacearchaeota archaeon]